MADDNEAALRRHNAVLSWVSWGLLDFAGMIVAEASAGGEINRAVLAEFKAGCIANLKNSEPSVLGIHRQANIEGEALGQVEQFIDSAISKLRPKNVS